MSSRGVSLPREHVDGDLMGRDSSSLRIGPFVMLRWSIESPLCAYIAVALIVGITASCGGGGTRALPPMRDQPSAGPDQTVAQDVVVRLTATGAGANEPGVTYRWVQTGGPSVVLNTPDQRVASFVSPVVSAAVVLTFELTLTDSRGKLQTDVVQVTVRPANSPPVVSAGTDRTARGDQVVTIAAQAQDRDGSISSMAWKQVSGPTVILENATSLTVRFRSPQIAQAADVVLQFTAIDDAGAAAADSVSVSVDATNFAPKIISATAVAATEGNIPIEVDFDDPNSEPLTWTLEVSLDQGSTWRNATFRAESLAPRATRAVTLWWNSIDDLGFRQTNPVQLRVTAVDAAGARSAVTVAAAAPAPEGPRAALLSAQNYAVYYGPIDANSIARLQQFDAVVIHPAPQAGGVILTRADVAAIQQGRDPAVATDDVIVLCYLAVGEDLRTAALTDAQLRADPRFIGDGTGPRVDPRGPLAYPGGLSLANIDVKGAPSPGGVGLASWLLDDNSYAAGVADGLPDRNPSFGGTYVNMGDPAWFNVIESMSSLQGDVPGLREILTTSFGRGLGCDGVLLDAIDTVAPNSFGATKFEWTAPGAKIFMERLRQRYPSALVMQNRGLFFFHSGLPQYAFTTRETIDALLFESYRLDSSPGDFFNPTFFCFNKRDYMPKVLAEASLNRGFRVFSLGYAEGPPEPGTGATLRDTLEGRSQYGLDMLLQDIDEAEKVAGFRHYLTNAALDVLNDFVMARRVSVPGAPRWSSTVNNKDCADADPDALPTPRPGLQAVVPISRGVQVFWDVALAENGVKYVLYYKTSPFNFTAPEPLQGASVVRINPIPLSSNPVAGTIPPFPLSATINDLSPDQTYFFLLRAREDSDGFPEEANRNVIAARPLP